MLARIGLTLLLMVLVAVAVLWLKQQQVEARSLALAGGAPPAVVTATRVQQLAWNERIEAVGSLTAIQDVAIASEVTGKVVDIAFESGAPVTAGEMLVRLDDDDDRALLQSLRAELRLAQVEHRRVANLRRSAAFSQSQLDRVESERASLEARVERQRVLVAKKTMRAPFDGVLGIRRVSLGSIVSPGDLLVRLQSVDPIYVDFTVPERHRSQLAVEQSLQVEVAAWRGERFAGTVTAVDPAVDVRSRTLTIRGELPNSERRLQPGMFATVHLIVGAGRDVLTLPRTAISFFAYGESVFRIDAEGDRLIVHRQPVEIGRTRDGRVEILSGLEPDEQVVHTGHLKLRDGQSVAVDNGISLPQGVQDG